MDSSYECLKIILQGIRELDEGIDLEIDEISMLVNEDPRSLSLSLSAHHRSVINRDNR